MKVTRLVCSRCGAPLSGLRTDRLFICRNCGAGWADSSDGLQRIEVEHRALPEAELPLPFWKLRASVHVLKRIVRNEFTSTILRFGSKYDAEAMPGKTKASEGSSDRRTFLFPAFHVNGLPGLGVSLSRIVSSLPPLIEESSGFPYVCGGTIIPTDAQVLGRCVAVGQETEKSDWLAEIELVLSSVKASLVILPCSCEVEKVHVAETGVSFFRRSAPEWTSLMEHRSSIT